MILISEAQLNALKERKGHEVTIDDWVKILENKKPFIKFIRQEIAEYQYNLGNGTFSGRRAEAELAIKALYNLIMRIEQIEKTLDDYAKTQEQANTWQEQI